MALTAEQIQAQIDALNEQIAAPERQITNATESVTYRSTADLIAARNDLQTTLNGINAGTSLRRKSKLSYLVYGGRGFTNGQGG